MAKNPRRLLIVSHVVHYRHEGRYFAYGPYVREIDIWADLFPEVTIAAPLREEEPPADFIAFSRSNIAIARQREIQSGRWSVKILSKLLNIPLMSWDLCKAMLRADAIQVRCPGNLGILGAIWAPLFSRNLVAKYAGQWAPFPGEPLSWRVQKAILRSAWWGSPVLVYGEWPNQPAHIIPFFTSIMSPHHIARAKASALSRQSSAPLRVMFSGRLSPEKRVDVLLAAVADLKDAGVDTSCTIVGDGPQRASLEKFASDRGLDSCSNFVGAVNFENMMEQYEKADVLVLVSQCEGWPKALAEAMAFGLVCVGSDRGLIPRMLGEGRGLTVPFGDAPALAAALRRVAENPDEFVPVRSRAAVWGQRYSLEDLRDSIRETLSARWGVSLS